MNAFRTKRLKEPSFWHRLWGENPIENGFIKINNLLAQQRDIRETPKQDIYRIVDEAGISVRKRSNKVRLMKLYWQLFNDTLKQPHLFEKRLLELKFLKHLFRLSDKEVYTVHKGMVQSYYNQNLDIILSQEEGSPLDEAVEHFLRKLHNRAAFSVLQETHLQHKNPNRILEYILHPSAEGMGAEHLSAKEIRLLGALQESLGMPSVSSPTRLLLHKCYLYHCMDNGLYPSIEPPGGVSRNEHCYVHIKSEWYERRRMVRYMHYDSVSLVVKTMQGMYWKTPLEEKRDLAEDVWENVDKGDLYVTTRQLIFLGEKKARTLSIDRIGNYVGYENGIEVQKDEGSSMFFLLPYHSDLVCMVLSKVIGER